MTATMRSVWVKKWDKLEIKARAKARGCFMGDVVAALLDAEVEDPAGAVGRHFTDPTGRARLMVYRKDMGRLRALAKAWGRLRFHQVISHLLREVGEREDAPEAGVESEETSVHLEWGRMVKRADGYRRRIAEYEEGMGY
jgi:hypothetical protein